jgi:hemolysin III
VQHPFGLSSSSEQNRLDARPAWASEFAADRWVHVLGLSFGAAGAAVLVARLATRPGHGDALAVLVYVVGLMAMLGCSAVYNLALRSPLRPLLRRFDHAAIFLMIAGTYTPFTTRPPEAAWTIALTGIIWAAALCGVLAIFAFPRIFARLSILAYLMLGWIVLVAFGPLTAGLGSLTIDLLVIGGVLYTVGIGFHLARTVAYQNAIWHGFVLGAAACHYAAILRLV